MIVFELSNNIVNLQHPKCNVRDVLLWFPSDIQVME